MFTRKDMPEGPRTAEGLISRRNFLIDAGLAVSIPAIIPASTPAKPSPVTGKILAAASPLNSAEGLVPVKLVVNGERYEYRVEPHWTLHQLLRDKIGLTSPKDWCGGHGACGSCTVIMNGRPVLSCMTLACECSGARIETAEGIAKEEHPIIQAYIRNNAFQCGYCTPGFVCTAKALLDRNANPTEADARDALGGNLCRCATYQRHPKAVLEAANNLKMTT